ncbi:hypothetical protein [uncultured Sulfitobacter sp.]|uniref:hypothetical protein n=1 Tax=uncultured Sulfitobacter sp. TaxID=191468 RepID=UPI002617435D|nr:hypothetical protein [uncultured Sulfitobacter sp.]
MTRKQFIAITGITLLAALALFDTTRQRAEAVSATVLNVTSTLPDAGADPWHVSVALPDQTQVFTAPQLARPTVVKGQSVCLRVISRRFGRTRYEIAADKPC